MSDFGCDCQSGCPACTDPRFAGPDQPRWILPDGFDMHDWPSHPNAPPPPVEEPPVHAPRADRLEWTYQPSGAPVYTAIAVVLLYWPPVLMLFHHEHVIVGWVCVAAFVFNLYRARAVVVALINRTHVRWARGRFHVTAGPIRREALVDCGDRTWLFTADNRDSWGWDICVLTPKGHRALITSVLTKKRAIELARVMARDLGWRAPDDPHERVDDDRGGMHIPMPW